MRFAIGDLVETPIGERQRVIRCDLHGCTVDNGTPGGARYSPESLTRVGVTPSIVAQWLRSRLTANQLTDVVAGRVLAGDLVDIPADWPEDVVMEGIESLAVTPSQIKSLAALGYRVTGEDNGNVYLTGNGENVMCPLSGIADFIAEMTPRN